MAMSDDMLLMAKQFMQIAKTFCPQPPVRVAKGVLITTIRSENTHYLGMNACNVYVGNEKAFYMPYTNEPWTSRRWIKKATGNNWNANSNFKTKKQAMQEVKRIRNSLYDSGDMSVLRKNPNEHWWDKAVAQVVALDLDQEKGVMIVG